MRNFNNTLGGTTKSRYGPEKSVFSQKSQVMSNMKQSGKLQHSVFGKPTFRDADGARDFFKTFEDKR